MRIVALGQAGFVFEGRYARLVVDPYLSDAIAASGSASGRHFVRRFPPPMSPTQLGTVDAVLLSHSHEDHCDPATLGPLLLGAPHAVVVGPSPVWAALDEAGIRPARKHRTRVGESLGVAPGCRITPVPAAHYALDEDADGEPSYVGYLIELDGMVCYHAGDTVRHPAVLDHLKRHTIDLALLPVNGRDAKREALGITGNLEPDEALTLASDIGATALVPMHNDLFDINRRPMQTVFDAWEASATRVPLLCIPAGGSISWPSRLEAGNNDD